jgi:hypothetical protein
MIRPKYIIRAHEVEQDLYHKHGQRIENIHVNLMRSQVSAMALCELDDTVDAAENNDDGCNGQEFVLLQN